MKGYWKIGIQTGPSATQRGWGDLVRNSNAAGRTVTCAASDVIPPDIQGNSLNTGNYIPTTDAYGQRFDLDYTVYTTEAEAHLAWQEFARIRWILFKEVVPHDINNEVTTISLENEQRGWLGWTQMGAFSGRQSIPGFTGWADCEGWQAYYTALEVLNDPEPYRYRAFKYSGGLPEPGAWEQPGMQQYLRLCEENPGVLGIGLHEYSFNDDLFHLAQTGGRPQDARGDLVFRFAYLHDACDVLGITRPPIYIAEFGYHERTLNHSSSQVKDDFLYAAEVYAQHPNIEGIAIWTTQRGWGDVNGQVESLIPWMEVQIIENEWDIEEPPEPPEPPTGEKIKFVEYIYAQEHDAHTADKVWVKGYENFKRTVGGSVDHAIAALTSPLASDESYAVVFDPHLASQQAAIADLEAAGVPYILDHVSPPPPAPFYYHHWPTAYRVITQAFGANPENYEQFGWTGGHEGVDIRAPYNTPYFAPESGVITRAGNKNSSGSISNYGYHIIIDHGNGYSSLLAHAREDLLVSVGDEVQVGDIICYSGNTGNSSGPHLHLSLKHQGSQTPGFPPGYIDPTPFLEPVYFVAPPEPRMEGYLYAASMNVKDRIGVATTNLNMRENASSNAPLLRVVGAGETAEIIGLEVNNDYWLSSVYDPDPSEDIDMKPYFLVDGAYGQAYFLANSWGEGSERTQLQKKRDDISVVSKNQQFEGRVVREDVIDFVIDTSPGNDEYYIVDSETGWMPRHWSPGDRFTRQEHNKFYRKSDCAPTGAESNWTTDLEFVAIHETWTSKSGIVLNDVIELAWHIGGRIDEWYYYAPGLGLVGWRKYDGRESWIERFDQNNYPNELERIPCLEAMYGI